MQRLLKEPLLHFLALGVLIYFAYGWLSKDQREAGEIVVTRGQQEHLATVFSRTWQRPPTPQEFEALLRDFLREEIAFREGMAMGLDQGDTIIRRRMRQKLELLTEDIVGLSDPTEEQLAEYLQENPATFRVEPRLSLRQIYISRDRRGESAEQDAQDLLERLENEPDMDWQTLGDPLPLGESFDRVRLGEVEGLFGQEFAAELAQLERGVWSGPVESGYGLHLVTVDHFEPSRNPDLDEVRDRVRTEWFAERRLIATDELYKRLAEKYTIDFEPFGEPESP